MISTPLQNASAMGHREFVFLMALMVSLDAFAIDAMLPALNLIGDEFSIAADNHRQYVVTSIFLGFAAGVLVYGLAADTFGRRRPVLVGFTLFIIGSLVAIAATSFTSLLIGRMLQGLGAAGPYVLAVTIVRDQYEGRKMAQTMSLIMSVFIAVPMIAPFVGQGLLLISGWRSIFTTLTVFASIALIWFFIRQPETLKPEHTQPFSVGTIWRSMTEVLTHTQPLRYLLIMGVMTGAFISHLSTGQQVFQDIYLLDEYFPLVFASLSGLYGIASYLNSRWVETVSSERLIHYALTVVVVLSFVYLIAYRDGSAPPLWAYLFYMSVAMASFAMLFGNLMTLALAPLGHIAGTASSVINALGTVIAVVVAFLIGDQLQDNTLPILLGFSAASLISWFLNYPQLKLGSSQA